MAKKSLEQLEADEKKLMEQLEALRSGKKQIAADEANESKTVLQAALADYNKLAVAAGTPALRLVSDNERAASTNGSGKAGRKPRSPSIALDEQAQKEFVALIAKEIKRGKAEGVSKNDIIAYLKDNGFALDEKFRMATLDQAVKGMIDAGEIKQSGKARGTKYHSM